MGLCTDSRDLERRNRDKRSLEVGLSERSASILLGLLGFALSGVAYKFLDTVPFRTFYKTRLL